MTFEHTIQWDNPVEVKTKNGLRILRRGDPSEAFWTAWKTNKKGLQAAGYTVAKDDTTGQFVVKHWSDAGGAQPPAQQYHQAPQQQNNGFHHQAPPAAPMHQPMMPTEVEAILGAFPGSQVIQKPYEPPAPVKSQPWDFKPELPPQGYRGMTPKQRFEFKLRAAAVEAIETELVSRDDLVEIMRGLAIQMQS